MTDRRWSAAGLVAAVLFGALVLAYAELPARLDSVPPSILAWHNANVACGTSQIDFIEYTPPGNLADLVAGRRGGGYDVVVEAEVIGVAARNPGSLHREFPNVELELDVKELVLDDGVVASGSPLLIRRLDLNSGCVDYPKERVGDRYLYLLERTDSAQPVYYSPWRPYSRLDVGGYGGQVH